MFFISEKTIAVVGGGPAGMMAAIAASSPQTKVILFDKMEETGKKLLVTGKGKCNLTHQINKIDEIFEGYPSGAQFLHSAFNKFPPSELIKFFESRGVRCKADRGRRMFPVSEKASDVRDALVDEMKKKNVVIRNNTPIVEIMCRDGAVTAVRTAQKEIIPCDRCILCAGGMTYPWTGSTGDGYIFAKKTGHSVVQPRPSLVPLEIAETHISFALEGLSLKNVKASVKADGRIVEQRFGEMLFTSYGVSGPIILYLSRKAVNCLAEKSKVSVSIDFKPAIPKDKLLSRIDLDIEKNRKKAVKNRLEEYLPQKLVPVFIQESGLQGLRQ
ncbi:MAG: aminoacetone oxidase family FAD-binding enzyme [bacterium]|nr:aminoacetone oxidase family FAD-binding enzyme [bacterium]